MLIDKKQALQNELRRVAHQAVAELEGVDTMAEAAKYVPVQYFGVMAGAEASTYKDGTFIVQKHNIIDIKRYVSASLRLPVDLGAVEKLLGYTESTVKRLEPRDIQLLHQRIHQHALSWGTLERDTKDLGSRLDLFSKGFINTGIQVVEHLKSFAGYKDLSGTIHTLNDAERAALAAVPLGNSDSERVQNLAKYFTRMKNDIESFYQRVSAVKALASEFSRKITEDLLPAVVATLGYVEQAGIEAPAQEEALRAQLKELDAHIAEKIAEYNNLVGYSFAGLVFGPIGVAITGGIFGSQAEKVRSQKNTLLANRDELLGRMGKTRFSQLLNQVGGRLSDMKILMSDAERGAKNLEDVWAIIWVSIEESSDRLLQLDNELDLGMLVLDLHSVIEPWGVIQGHANALSRVFNEVVG